MAEMSINELIEIIKEHPHYIEEWKKGIDANQALYVWFHEEKVKGVSSEVFTVKNGSELVLDLDEKGVVVGMEFI